MDSEPVLAHAQSTTLQKAGIALVAIFVSTLSLILFSIYLQGNSDSILADPVSWFNNIDPAVAFDIISTTAELLAAVLAIAITVIAIVVELAANRYSHRITSLFVREPINIAVMCFFVVATVFSLWIALTLDAAVDDAILVNSGLLASMILVTISLIVLLPYFAFVMSFLSPVSVIGKIRNSAFVAIKKIDEESAHQSQLEFLDAVDELQNIARRSSELSDRAVETVSVNAMLELLIEYQNYYKVLNQRSSNWFELSDHVRKDPDFVSINETSLNQIVADRIWVEVKILRQYLDLISDGNPGTRDTSYLIAINTKKIALESLEHRPELEIITLCMRCFNSYLRATINSKDARTGYYIMNQYRMLAEELFKKGNTGAVKEIALHLQFYGLLGLQQGIPFLLEVVAEDIAELANDCIGKDDKLLAQLVSLLLDLDQEVKNETQEESLLGVRRAQLKLAAVLAEHGDAQQVTRICNDLKQERPDRKEQLIDMLMSEDRKEYWEFTDRGVNFAYLAPQYKRHLESLAAKFR